METTKKITLSKILQGETSYPVTLDEFKNYCETVTFDVENLLFYRDLEHFRQFYEYLNTVTFFLPIPIPSEHDKGTSSFVSVLTRSSTSQQTSSSNRAAGNSKTDTVSTYLAESTIYFANEKKLKSALWGKLVVYGIVKEDTTTAIPSQAIIPFFLQKMTQELIDIYLTSQSAQELNIPNAIVVSIKKRASTGECSPSIFEDAKREAIRNISENALPRFLNWIATENINQAQSNERLVPLVLGTVGTIIGTVLLAYYRYNNLYRLALFPLPGAGMIGYLQYTAKFCIIFGTAGIRNGSDARGDIKKVVETCVLQDHRVRRRRFFLQSLAFGFLVASVLVALPCWVFYEKQLSQGEYCFALH